MPIFCPMTVHHTADVVVDTDKADLPAYASIVKQIPAWSDAPRIRDASIAS